MEGPKASCRRFCRRGGRDEKSPVAQRAMNAMLKMSKLDIEEMKRACEG
jgi:hypothetical protein